MAQVAIEKAYQLKALGGQAVYDDLDRIHKKFKEIAEVKKALNLQMGNAKDTQEYKDLAEQLKKVQKEYKALALEMERVKVRLKEVESMERREAAAAKRNSADKIAAAKAVTEAAKQATEAAKQATQQSIRDINAERQAAAQAAKELKQLQLQRVQNRMQVPAAAPGSYNDIAAQFKTTLAHYKATVNMQDVAALTAAQQHLMQLKTQLDSFNRSLTQDKVLIGEYTTGVMNAFKRMGLGHLITDQVNTAKSSLHTLNTEFGNLKQQLDAIRQAGVGDLQAVERMLIENRQAAMSLEAELGRIQAELRGIGSIGSQVTSALRTEFANLKQQFVGFVVAYLGFQQVITGIHSAIRINYELSDSFADIKNRIHGTTGEVEDLIDSLKALDTRSSLTSLVDIAAVLSKKGVAKQEIAGVTKSVDDLMVALGREMGDPKETVASLVKLVTVYSEDKHVTADNINAIGGAIAKLSTSGVATGAFLVDFAERMAGIRGITGITIDKVLGLGAALQEIGLRTEVSSTALSQIIIKLFTDPAKYAQLAEMDLKDYKRMLENDVLGTFVTVAEKLKGNAAEMDSFFSNAVDMHLRGARAISVIGDIAGNVDYARKRMDDASKALKQHGLVAEMAATKQDTFAASVDRVKKSFELAYSSKGMATTLNLFAKAIILLIALMPTLIKLGVVMLAGWVAQNTQLVLLRAQLVGYTLAQWAYTAALRLASIAQAAYAVGLGLLTGITKLATGATVVFNTVLAASPLGAALLLIGALVAVMGLLAAGAVYAARAIQGNTAALTANARELMFRQQIAHKADEQVSESINKIKIYTNVLKDNTVSQEMHKKALEDLIALNPEYLKGLTEENIRTEAGTRLVDKYVESLKKKAQYEAALAAQAELNRKDIKLQTLEYGLLQKRAAGLTSSGDLSDEESEYLPGILNPKRFKASSDLDAALTNIREQRAELAKELEITEKVVEEKYKSTLKPVVMGAFYNEDIKKRAEIEEEINRLRVVRDYYAEESKEYGKYTNEIEDLIGEWLKAGGRTPMAVGADLVAVRAEIKKYNKKNKNSGDEVLLGLLKTRRKELFDEMEKSEAIYFGEHGKGSKGKGSRLDIMESEAIKRINAHRDNKITALRTAYMEEDVLKKTFNERLIDKERVFQEELQKIEEDAIRAKIRAIHGGNAAEMQAKAKLHLELLESQKKYGDKYYHMDAEQAKADLERSDTSAKDAMERVTDSPDASGVEKSIAKLEYYNSRMDAYKEYMSAMDALEKKYRQQSEKNSADREKALQAIEHQVGKSLYDIRKEANENEYDELRRIHAAEMRKILEDKIRATQAVIADPNLNSGAKKEAMEHLGQYSDLKMLDAGDAAIDRELELTQWLYDQKLITAKDYYDTIDRLNEETLNNAIRRYDIEAEKKQIAQDRMTQVAQNAVDLGKTIGDAALQAASQRDAVNDRRKDREVSRNKRVVDSQAQSLREKQANDAAHDVATEQRERQRAEKQKSRTLAAMALEYAAAAFKIVAANIWKGPAGWAEAGIEEAFLAATYAVKIGMAASTPAYAAGGEVPGSGGEFGGSAHGNGGTPFVFRGRSFEAEANELAIINKRSARSNDTYTVTGTPKQIASRVNAIGGGVDFAPGAFSSSALGRFDRGVGWMASSAQVPSFISAQYARAAAPRYGNSDRSDTQAADGRFEAMHREILSLTSHVHTIQVGLNPQQVSDYQSDYKKNVSVGAI